MSERGSPSHVESEDGSGPPHQQVTALNPELVEQVFDMFKGYLASQLDAKGNELEGKAKTEKEATEFKFKGNRKQFEFNSRLVQILCQVEAYIDNPTGIRRVVGEGQDLIKKRQKLIKLADRSKDGWQVVQEYESDDLASDSEDEKRIRKAKSAAEKKRKYAKYSSNSGSRKFKFINDNQFFRDA